MIAVVLVDDQSIIREGLKSILSLSDEITVAGECSSGQELIDLLKTQEIKVDIALVDISMPVMNGIELSAYLKENYPEIKVLILTSFQDTDFLYESMKNGIYGYILKSQSADAIINAIKNVATGSLAFDSHLMPQLYSRMGGEGKGDALEDDPSAINIKLRNLSLREKEIVKYVVKGQLNKEIASTLYIAEGTIKNHLFNIYRKLNVKNRAQLISLVTSNDPDMTFL